MKTSICESHVVFDVDCDEDHIVGHPLLFLEAFDHAHGVQTHMSDVPNWLGTQTAYERTKKLHFQGFCQNRIPGHGQKCPDSRRVWTTQSVI